MMMLEELEEKLPPEAIWIDLMEALTWVAFRHSVSLPEYLVLAGAQPTDFGSKLQDTWRDIADQGTVGRIQIRGKRDGAHDEQDLSVDDLRNCRFLVWTPRGNLNHSGMETSEGRTGVLRVERRPATFEGSWDRLDEKTPGFDYYDVVVRREQLMELNPREKPSVRKAKAKVGAQALASAWLGEFCDSNPPRTKTKLQLIVEMQDTYRLSQRQALAVWDLVAADRPAWRAPGRPRKNPTPRIISI
jgi:hypothetical protein